MIHIHLNLGNRSYPIHVEMNLMTKIPSLLKEKNHGQKWVIISQYRLMEFFGFELLNNLRDNGFNCDFITVPAGETAKSLNEFSRIMSQLVEMNCDRSTTILALGGGVVGDVAGFAASSYMRGIDYVQIPTTLLAMVDSSIGGKTGINIAEGKNLVGHIYQPQAVLVDPKILQSLPKEEVVSGLGEIIKYGAIKDKDFLANIAKWLDNLDSFPFEEAVAISCKIKAEIVEQDEREGNLRRLLNFGHTIGHALEAHLGFGKLRHGEAVAYGMMCAGFISQQLGYLSKNDAQFLHETILKLPLPTIGQQNSKHLMKYIRTDKKNEKGKLNFVVLKNLGHAVTSTEVSEELIKESLKALP